MQLQSIQALRAIAALAVLVTHIAQNESAALNDPISPTWMAVGASGVDLFFVISGVVMVYVTRQASSSYSPLEIARFLYSRVTRIYPTYWAVSIAVILGYLVLPIDLTRSLDDFNIVASLLLLPDTQPPVLLIGWTLIHEMYFYLAFALMLAAPCRWLPALLGLWLGAVVSAQAFGLSDINPWTAIAFHPLTLEFILGCVVGLLVVSGRRAYGAAALGLGLVWWLSAGVMLAPYDSFTDVPMGWERVAAWGAPAALIIYGAICLELDHNIHPNKTLARMGDWSYALYLCHLPIIVALRSAWPSNGPELGPFDNILMMTVAALACLAVAALAFYGFEKPTLRLARRVGTSVFKSDRPAGAHTRPAGRIW
jgi:exopolysaccharide production protein ExoZ